MRFLTCFKLKSLNDNEINSIFNSILIAYFYTSQIKITFKKRKSNKKMIHIWLNKIFDILKRLI